MSPGSVNMHALNFTNISIHSIELPIFINKCIQVSVLRLDALHEIISGNKWFKLQFYIQEALHAKKERIITFGGAWSNHIVATAAAAKLNGLKSLGIIRGEKPISKSQTLADAESSGMELYFISRSDYSEKQVPNEVLSKSDYIIPEGGFGELGAKGAATIFDQIDQSARYTHICCAVGTGTMMSGLMNAAGAGQIVGINVLKNSRPEDSIRILLNDRDAYIHLHNEYHFGGYAKFSQPLIDFMNEFYQQTGIPTDFVYTAKLIYAVMDLIANDHFPESSNLLIIHSGGLQGNRSLGKGTLIF